MLSGSIVRALVLCCVVNVAAGLPAMSSPVKKVEHVFHGLASLYAHKFQGKKTASGDRYDDNKLTCAHRTLPFGTKLLVTNPDSGSECIVVVNDRGPFHSDRVVDLSKAAARKLGISGIGRVVCCAGKQLKNAVDIKPNDNGKIASSVSIHPSIGKGDQASQSVLAKRD